MEPSQILTWVEIIAKSLGIPFALFTAFRGINEYRTAQKWKKSEFLAKEAKEFFADKYVTRAQKILDYSEYDLPVYQGELPGDDNHIRYNQDFLLSALSVSEGKKGKDFTPEEKLIRDIMDEFLTKLTYFNRYLDSGLITMEDLRPYLYYWINILGNPESGKRSRTVMKQVWDFIEFFEYTEIKLLVKKFGYIPDFKPGQPKNS